ncbi:MAG: RsmD family RNA methyltransferase [Deltaproteobacteria bacterium]|nr:RsmD family RNA methyltransferase [Deltaproteobacteria bacterium]
MGTRGEERESMRASASELISVLVPGDEHSSASERVVCEHADRCGGCPVIGLPYGEQLAMKRGRVVQSASRYPALELVYTEPVAAAEPIVEYRTRAKLIVSVGAKLGLYAKGGGHQVVDIPRCRVLSPALAAVAATLRARIVADDAQGGPLAPFDPGGAGALRAVDLREVYTDAGSKVLVTLVVQRGRAADRAVLEAAARSLCDAAPSIAGVAVNFHEGESPQILGSETVVVHGAASAEDRVGNSRHHATYGSFVQAHRGQAARVHATLTELLGLTGDRSTAPRPKVLDLYGGSGAIALALASAGAEVHLVESFAPAAAHADQAAKSQNLPVRAEAADVASALRRLGEQKARFDAVVVNPPRRGVSPPARELVARLDVSTIAYVSCDPDTLARDLDHFSRLGFGVSTLRPLDMIPLTDEVETVAVVRRIGVPPPKVAYEDEDILIVEKGAHEPTVPQPEYASSLLQRVRKLANAQDAVPVHRHDVGTTGLVMFVRDPEQLVRWQAVLASETSRKIYVAGARGVTPSKGAITRDLREDGKMYPARTRYRRLAVASGHSVLRVIPEQGRTHQIRRHLAAIGHPVLGDDRYGHAPTNRFFEEKNALDRTFLHCVRLEFDHPNQLQRLLVEAPMPGDLRGVLERTSGPGTLRFLDHKNALGHSGQSSLPPPPDDLHDRGSALDVDTQNPSTRTELTTDDDDVGNRDSSV